MTTKLIPNPDGSLTIRHDANEQYVPADHRTWQEATLTPAEVAALVAILTPTPKTDKKGK
jgi:hypothetical protein